MIFVTVGTQKFQMNRLIETMDRFAENYSDEVVMQIGNSDYMPKNCEYYKFIKKEEFAKLLEKCDVLVTHAGVGSIMDGIRANKPVVAIPRLKKYDEHVDDHQLEVAQALGKEKCILVCSDMDELPEILENVLQYPFQKFTEPEQKVKNIVTEQLKQWFN